MQIQQFLHIALNVTDLAKAEHFYSEILGMTQADRPLDFPGIWYQIGPYQLHLIVAPANQPSPNHDRWGRNRHLAFAVADVAAVKQRLKAAGQAFQVSGSGRPAVFVRDPDDNVIELGEIA
jgi:glyoxylase I family protein